MLLHISIYADFLKIFKVFKKIKYDIKINNFLKQIIKNVHVVFIFDIFRKNINI